MKKVVGILLCVLTLSTLCHAQGIGGQGIGGNSGATVGTAKAIKGTGSSPGACTYAAAAPPVIVYSGALYLCSAGGTYVAITGASGANVALSNLSGVGTGASGPLTCSNLSNSASGCSTAAMPPGGSGTELQYRSSASAFGALLGSSVDALTGDITLAPAGSIPGMVPGTLGVINDLHNSLALSVEGVLDSNLPGSFNTLVNSTVIFEDSAGGGLTLDNTQIVSILHGTNMTGDGLTGLAVLPELYTAGGDMGSFSSIIAGPIVSLAGPNPLTATAVNGIEIWDQFGIPLHDASSIQAGLSIKDQTPALTGSTYSILTGQGLVNHGDKVSPGIDTLGWGIPSIADPTLITFTGSGLNDLATGGFMKGLTAATYCVKIDGVAPDTFSWGVDPACVVFTATLVPFTGVLQAIGTDGVMISAAITGHTLADTWTFNVLASPGDGYEFNASDADTPTSEGATCTNVGDHAGARAIYLRGDIKCF